MLLEDPQQEAFAQARFAGKSLAEAHYVAGYSGDKASASRLGRLHEIKERIAELYREAASQTVYEKTDAIRDLLSIIHACPSEASDDNPLCEARMGKDGPYHRFPPKLQAMVRLIKLMGWDEPVKVEVALKDNFIELLAKIRRRPKPKEEIVVAPAPTDPISPIGPICPIPPAPAFPSTLNPHPSTKLPAYTRDSAIGDLVSIIHALPTQASSDHPLCEMRRTSWGSYHRFPSKLAAITLLIKMLGWNGPMKLEVEHDPDAKFKILAECIRQRS